MPGEVERYIRIQDRTAPRRSGARLPVSWRTIPNCEKVRVLEYLVLSAPNEETGADEKRFVFHIKFIEGLRKGARVVFLGNHFMVRDVSDSKRLVGLELSCTPATPADLD